jgi:hypothetical protein
MMDKLGIAALFSAGAALVAGASYVDAHLGVSRDVGQILADRRFTKRIDERIHRVGEFASIYGHLLVADPAAEGLWFEGKSWTYSEILYRE